MVNLVIYHIYIRDSLQHFENLAFCFWYESKLFRIVLNGLLKGLLHYFSRPFNHSIGAVSNMANNLLFHLSIFFFEYLIRLNDVHAWLKPMMIFFLNYNILCIKLERYMNMPMRNPLKKFTTVPYHHMNDVYHVHIYIKA